MFSESKAIAELPNRDQIKTALQDWDLDARSRLDDSGLMLRRHKQDIICHDCIAIKTQTSGTFVSIIYHYVLGPNHWV